MSDTQNNPPRLTLDDLLGKTFARQRKTFKGECDHHGNYETYFDHGCPDCIRQKADMDRAGLTEEETGTYKPHDVETTCGKRTAKADFSCHNCMTAYVETHGENMDKSHETKFRIDNSGYQMAVKVKTTYGDYLINGVNEIEVSLQGNSEANTLASAFLFMGKQLAKFLNPSRGD